MSRRGTGPGYHWRGCLKLQPQVCGGDGPWAEGCRRRGGPLFLPWSESGLAEGEGPGQVKPWSGCLELQLQGSGEEKPWAKGSRQRGGLAEERPRAGRR